MEQQLVLLLCFTGIVPCVLSETRKYFLVQQEKSWTDARVYCQAEHTDLAIVKSNDNMIELQSEAQTQNLVSSAWIGMYSDINSWRWSLNNEPVGNIRTWYVGEPNNRNGKQNCAVITPWGWWDLDCTELQPFLCFDETKTGHDRYIYISNETKWLEARAYCQQYYSDLASPRDEAENLILIDLVPGVTWFGMIKDPWKWVDNTIFSTISWMTGQPNNYWWDETCGYLEMGQVADAQCTDVMPFFCYSALLTRHIVKMKIQSDQDLNNPVVNAAILEKIKQKLKDAGLEKNITVKWKVKPDGVIFQKETETKTENP